MCAPGRATPGTLASTILKLLLNFIIGYNYPITGHEGPRGMWTQRSTYSQPRHYDEVGWLVLRSANWLYRLIINIGIISVKAYSISSRKNLQNNILHNFGDVHSCVTTNSWCKKKKKKTLQNFTPLNILKLNVAHNLLLYSYIAYAKFRWNPLSHFWVSSKCLKFVPP